MRGVIAFSIVMFFVQDRVRELESEIEWIRAERQDAQQVALREQKQMQARIKEAEDAASRAKAARRCTVYIPAACTDLYLIRLQCSCHCTWHVSLSIRLQEQCATHMQFKNCLQTCLV